MWLTTIIPATNWHSNLAVEFQSCSPFMSCPSPNIMQENPRDDPNAALCAGIESSSPLVVQLLYHQWVSPWVFHYGIVHEQLEYAAKLQSLLRPHKHSCKQLFLWALGFWDATRNFIRDSSSSYFRDYFRNSFQDSFGTPPGMPCEFHSGVPSGISSEILSEIPIRTPSGILLGTSSGVPLVTSFRITPWTPSGIPLISSSWNPSRTSYGTLSGTPSGIPLFLYDLLPEFFRELFPRFLWELLPGFFQKLL